MDFAVYLGIDPSKEQDLLWIAEECLSASLPPNWTEHTSSRGDIYFYNRSPSRPNSQSTGASPPSPRRHPCRSAQKEPVTLWRRRRRRRRRRSETDESTAEHPLKARYVEIIAAERSRRAAAERSPPASTTPPLRRAQSRSLRACFRKASRSATFNHPGQSTATSRPARQTASRRRRRRRGGDGGGGGRGEDGPGETPRRAAAVSSQEVLDMCAYYGVCSAHTRARTYT